MKRSEIAYGSHGGAGYDVSFGSLHQKTLHLGETRQNLTPLQNERHINAEWDSDTATCCQNGRGTM